MTQLTLYCVCYGNNYPRDTQFNQRNIMTNAANMDSYHKDNLRRQGFVLDDEGQNISYLNYTFGDLTATYWIWKNAKEDFVGTNQYRRFWVEDAINQIELDDKTIYISAPPVNFDTNVYDQYINIHGNLGMDILSRLTDINGFPLNNETLLNLKQVNYMTVCNMFFCYRPIYNKICEILFSILFPVYSEAVESLGNLDNYQRRMIAFLSERVITAIMLNHRYYFGDKIQITAIPYRQI